MEPDIDALYESHYEQFIESCSDDRELEYLVECEFGTHQEHWEMKEFGRYPEGILQRAFDALYYWDAEYLVLDPKSCVECYAHRSTLSSYEKMEALLANAVAIGVK